MSKQRAYGVSLPRLQCKLRSSARNYLVSRDLLVKMSKQRSCKDERHGNGIPWRCFEFRPNFRIAIRVELFGRFVRWRSV